MSKQLQKVVLFMDDNAVPFAEYTPPIKIDIDTTRLVDGEHVLKIVALSSDGKEGIQQIAFTVRNGPAISVHWITVRRHRFGCDSGHDQCVRERDK